MMRVRRLAASGLVIVVIVALGSIGVANVLPSGHHASPAASVAPTPGPDAACAKPSTSRRDVPAWAASARPPVGVPHLLSPDGNVIAFLFAYPLITPESPRRANKILWVVRQPRDGHPLVVTATRVPAIRGLGPVRMSFPADSGPGEIYPSDDNVPVPGCWHFALAWNGHHSSVNLPYVALPPVAPASTTPITRSSTRTTVASPTTVPHTAAGGCATASLTISLGAPNGTAGHFNYEIGFRNRSAAPCTLSGYPGVSFVDSAGHDVGVPASRNPIAHAPVTVAPGATAYAHLAITDPSVLNGCPAATVAQIRVYPPNETHAALVAAPGVQVCSTNTPGSTIDPVVDRPS